MPLYDQHFIWHANTPFSCIVISNQLQFSLSSFNTTGLFWMIPFGVSAAARLVFDASYAAFIKKKRKVCL